MPNLAQQLVAVHAERLEFHEHNVVMGCGKHLECLFAFRDTLGFIAPRGEVVAEYNGEADVTIDNQNSGIHGFGCSKNVQSYKFFSKQTNNLPFFCNFFV